MHFGNPVARNGTPLQCTVLCTVLPHSLFIVITKAPTKIKDACSVLLAQILALTKKSASWKSFENWASSGFFSIQMHCLCLLWEGRHRQRTSIIISFFCAPLSAVWKSLITTNSFKMAGGAVTVWTCTRHSNLVCCSILNNQSCISLLIYVFTVYQSTLMSRQISSSCWSHVWLNVGATQCSHREATVENFFNGNYSKVSLKEFFFIFSLIQPFIVLILNEINMHTMITIGKRNMPHSWTQMKYYSDLPCDV